MGRADYYKEGDYNATCSMCGFKRKASELVKNWQGQYRCPEHNEPRHPQEYVRATPDVQTPPWVQPQADVFIGVCDLLGMSSIADFAVADCSICDTPVRYEFSEFDLDAMFTIETEDDLAIQTEAGQEILYN